MFRPESRTGEDQSGGPRDEDLKNEAILRDLLSHETNPFHASYPWRVGFRETPGGELLNRAPEEIIDHNTRMATDRGYMLEQLQADGSLIGTINNRWAIAVPLAGYDAEHITVFRMPESLSDTFGTDLNLPVEQLTNLAGHSGLEQAEFLKIGRYFLHQLAQRHPDTHYIFGVNRSLRPRPELGMGGQSVPILHGHIFPTLRSTETQIPFREAYRIADRGTDAAGWNNRLLKLRASHQALEFAKRLASSITDGYSPLADMITRDDPNFKVAVADRWLEVKMSPDWDSRLNQFYLNQIIISAERVFDKMSHSPADTYSWTIDDSGNMWIGLTPYASGTVELHNIILDRTKSVVDEGFAMRQSEFRSTIEQLIPDLQQEVHSSEETMPSAFWHEAQ